MDRRLKLDEILKKILGSDNVYFQPPPGFMMRYPCIKYQISGMDTHWANNQLHINTVKYQVMYIDRNPDNSIIFELIKLPMITFDRSYKTDGLNHYVFDLFY